MSDLVSHQGGCHCGAVRYRAQVDLGGPVISCNCSMCGRAGTLLTFIPAAGYFINAQLLGGPNNHMIGNVIESKFLELSDYPSAAAMSFILMGAILAFVAVYAFIVGTEQLTGTAV